ncbi:MAG TPA: hypothetical protein VJL83_00380, partial [Patescibacteria group bacterium]|nr:hypothetical protein [Patescibacteria group bacterium]
MTETQTPERLADSPLLFIASDIDATFIDHATYSYEAAKPTFDRALESGAAIHFISSKTLAEMIPLQQELGILGKQSLSGENGSVSLIPVDYYDEKVAEELPGVLNIREYSIGNNTFMAIEYARPISQALAALDETTYEAGLHEEQVETITRMSPERFSELTGLTVEEAKRGQIREYQ